MSRKKKIRRIHVNRHVIASNRALLAIDDDAQPAPVFRVKTSGQNVPAHVVETTGPCRFVYRPGKPLSCGAVAWVETRDPVICDGVEV